MAPTSNRVLLLQPGSAGSAVPRRAGGVMKAAPAAVVVDPLALLEPHQPIKPRKRERLTTLTPEEKMNRRKFKNRVAAQTARDRKKERTCGLEDAVRALVEENEKLKQENESLHARLARLEAAFSASQQQPQYQQHARYTLQQEEEMQEQPCAYPGASSHRAVESQQQTKSLEPAAFIHGLQQREQDTVSSSESRAEDSRSSRTASLMRLLLVLSSLRVPAEAACSFQSSPMSTPFCATSKTSMSTSSPRISLKKTMERRSMSRRLQRAPRPLQSVSRVPSRAAALAGRLRKIMMMTRPP